MSQVWESGESQEWWSEDWSGEWGYEEGNQEQEGSQQQQQQQPVQSLILSPLVHDIFPPHVTDFQTGLFLEDDSVSDSIERKTKRSVERCLACQFQFCMFQKVVVTDCFVNVKSVCCERDVFPKRCVQSNCEMSECGTCFHGATCLHGTVVCVVKR